MNSYPEVVFPVLVAVLVWRSLAAGGGSASGPAPTLKDGDVFDYIVVGAGAGGSAAAARLALAGRRVLLLEAGGPAPLLSKIPNLATVLMGTEVDWFYETIPNNKSCLAHPGGQCRFIRGCCLGGSTAINYMLYTRGHPRDYDFDVPGWSWRDLRPYFLRSEGLRGLSRLPPSSHRYHNTSGRVAIGAFERSGNPWNGRIVRGLRTLRFPFNADVSAQSQVGVTRVLGFVSGGERVSAATAYLDGADVMGKLKVESNTRCTGVIIDDNNVARGVTVADKHNRSMSLYVKHDVILSAGTIGTAQLLMLSGVGVAGHLQQMGIPVRADLPVGENVSDHVFPIVFIQVHDASSASNLYKVLGAKGLDFLQWLATRSGPMASAGVTDIMGFLNTHCYDFNSAELKNNGPQCSIPNIQLIFLFVERFITRIAANACGRVIGANACDQIIAANENSALLVVSPILLTSKSRGSIRLASRDSAVPPAITPNYLDEDGDVDELVSAIAVVEQLVRTPTFKEHNASLLRLEFPDCPSKGGEYWACYVRQMSWSAQHAVGSAALGSVLDARLGVRGVRGLRVADASVLPAAPRGNTAAAAIAVGERVADLILGERNGRR